MSPTGKYRIGPEPNGRIRSGRISPQELRNLKAAIDAFTAEDLGAALECAQSGYSPGTEDTVTLVFGIKPTDRTVIYESHSIALGGSECTVGDPSKGNLLHQELHALLHKYDSSRP